MSAATKAQCLSDAGLIFGEAVVEMLNAEPRMQAEAAYLAGGPTVTELERRIVAAQEAARTRRAA